MNRTRRPPGSLSQLILIALTVASLPFLAQTPSQVVVILLASMVVSIVLVTQCEGGPLRDGLRYFPQLLKVGLLLLLLVRAAPLLTQMPDISLFSQLLFFLAGALLVYEYSPATKKHLEKRRGYSILLIGIGPVPYMVAAIALLHGSTDLQAVLDTGIVGDTAIVFYISLALPLYIGMTALAQQIMGVHHELA